jgi:protein TonB
MRKTQKNSQPTRVGRDQERRKKVNENPVGIDFADLLLENPHLKRPHRSLDVLISLAGQVAFVILLILIPLYYTRALNLPEFEKTMLVISPPPPPPPPSNTMRVIAKPKASLFNNGKLIAPRAIPKQIAIVKETAPQPLGLQGVAGGVPGGVPGGTLAGVLGGVLSGKPVPPPPRQPVTHGPLRVGGRVQAPRLVRDMQPTYPALARETRTQGTVVLDCVIDPQGNVTKIQLISGHPLLVQAALNAVRLWKYQPTLLNGQPVAVEMRVTVNFSLGS